MDTRVIGRHERARVKSIAAHKKSPLALVAIYNGAFELWNTAGMSLLKSGSIGEIPIRAIAFLEEAECFVLGADDGSLRMYCVDTFELKKKVSAHSDFVRDISVHPSLPYVASCSDDGTIKIWDYSKDFFLLRTMKGHTHFVMSLQFAPKEGRVLASCSLDHDVRLWSLETSECLGVLKGAQSGLNSLFYLTDSYIAAGADNGCVYLWDASTRGLLASVQGHAGPVTAVAQMHNGFITAGEDGNIREWSRTRYRPEICTPARLQRVWSIALAQNGCILAGGDEGICFMERMQRSPLFCFRPLGNEARIIVSDNSVLKQAKTSNHHAVKKITTLSYIPDRLDLSETGRYLAIESEDMVYIYTLLGVLAQATIPGRSLIWTGPEEFLVVTNGEVHKYAELDAQPVRVAISPPQIGKEEVTDDQTKKDKVQSIARIDRSSMLVVFESHRACISTLHGLVVRSAPGDAVAVYAHGSVYCMVHRDRIEFVQKNEEASQIPGPGSANSVPRTVHACPVLSSCQKDGVVFVHSTNSTFYAIIPEQLGQNDQAHTLHESALEGVPREAVLIGATEFLWYLDGGRIEQVSIPWALIEFERSVISGKVPDKLPEGMEKECVHLLVGMNRLEAAWKLTSDPDEKFELLLRLGRLQEARKMADSEIKYNSLCTLFVRQGQIREALRCAKKGASVEDEVVLSVLANDTDNLRSSAHRAQKEGKNLLALVAAYRTGNTELCRDLLSGTPFETLFSRTHQR